MKEDQQSTLTRAEATVSWSWPVEQLRESNPSRDAIKALSVDESQTRTTDIVLFFLDLARATGDAAYLEVAKAGAKHLAHTWENLAANPAVIHTVINSSYANGLSRAAFALAEAWKVTRNPVYQDAGLNIIRYIAEMESAAGRRLDPAHRGEKQ